MTLDSARGSDGCEASPRLPTGLCGSRIRTDDSLYIPCSGVLLLDDRLAADGHGGAGASHTHQMEALQTDEQITPNTTVKRHTAAGRARHRPRSLKTARVEVRSSPGTSTSTRNPRSTPGHPHSTRKSRLTLLTSSAVQYAPLGVQQWQHQAVTPGRSERHIRHEHHRVSH